ncbi:clustered mitochondria protein homolog isoform X2 [Dysidea avara]|uniref:clustered mitochondria protein homolog isoform X2 n=1 Tax=Dysidea avara TaxID=196820 RepID=UPI00332F2898
MPHVGPLRSEEDAKCPHEKHQSPGEDGQHSPGVIEGGFPPGLVTLATTSKDEVKLLQELGFQLVEIAPATTTSQPAAAGLAGDKEGQGDAKAVEVGGLSLMLDIPGVADPIRVVMTGTEMVQELRQFVVERNESVYRTCVGLYHKGARLEEFLEIANIEGVKNGSVIKFEEEPYSLREARIHVCRIKELLVDSIDLLTSGSEGLSFSFLSRITITNPEEEVNKISGGDTAGTSKEAIQPPDYCLPSSDITDCRAPPLSAFYPHGYHSKPPDCLKALYYNNHNPPSPQRKLKGDLLYLTVHTLEGQQFGITSCQSGFYVNKGSGDQHFDPNPAKLPHQSHHLIGVFNQISPLFKKYFAMLQKQTSKRHALELLPSPFKVYPWLVPQLEHVPDNYFTLEGVYGTKVSVEEQFVGQSQDWNEQFQTIKEMTTENVAQKVLKDKAYYKLYMEYCNIAARGAVAAVDGNIPPINCSEHVKQRMFIWNNIFFTFAFDGRDNYSDIGGDQAAWRAASHDLTNLSILNTCDAQGIYSSATVVVDYRGYRVTAQTIIPGILSHTQDDCIAYGTMDNGRSISNHESFLDKLKPVAKEFYLKEENLLDQNGQEVSLVSSMDVKGIIGQDNRCYVLDLFRMLPPDANWFRWPEDCNIGKREKRQTSCDDKTSSTTSSNTDNIAANTVSMSTRVVTVPGDVSSATTGVERTQTTTEEHTCGNTTKDTLINSDGVTNDDTHTDSDKTGDPVKEERIDKVCDTSTDEATHFNKPSDVGSDNTSPRHSDAIPEEVTHTNGTTSDALIDRKTNTDSDGDTTDDNPVSNTSPEHTTTGSNITNTGGDRDIAVSTSSDIPQGEQTTEGDIATSSQNNLPYSSPHTSDDTDDIMESVTTPGAKTTGTTRSVGTSTTSNEEKNRRILETFMKRMKENQHGHRLKLLRPELVKAFIHFKRIIYVQVLSATMEAVRRRKEQSSSAKKDRDHVINNDDARHPPEMTNGIAEDQPHLSDADTEGSQPHPSNLTNDIHQSERIQSPTNIVKTSLDESHSDLLSNAIPDLVNGTCSPTEHSEATATQTATNSTNHNTSDHEAEAAKIGANLNREAYLDIKFNIDLFTPGAHHNKSEEELHKDYQLLTDISNFLVESVIPKMIQDCSHLLVVPSDGESLRNVMHSRGINMRYLGLIAELSVQRPNLDHLYRLCVIEMISRTVKRILQKDMQQASLHNVVTVVVHFLNCYLCTNIFTLHHRLMARIHFLANESVPAMCFQHKAVMVFERVLGVDHPDTVSAYVNLALYCHHCDQTQVALRVMYRAHYLISLMFGDDSPEIATCDSNIALMLHSCKEYDLSVSYLEHALKLNTKYHGEGSIQVALNHHLIARGLSFTGDFRLALQHEKITYNIHKEKFGESHHRTLESTECLQQLTEKAVKMQKKINEITSKFPSSSRTPVTSEPSSGGDVKKTNKSSKPAKKKSRSSKFNVSSS